LLFFISLFGFFFIIFGIASLLLYPDLWNKQGAIVFATCLNDKYAQLLKQECSNNVHIVMMDITSNNDIEKKETRIK